MPSDLEIETAYTRLRAALTQSRLDWVREQIDEEIARGKTEAKTVEETPEAEVWVLRSPTEEPPRVRRRTKATLSYTRPFTVKESLELLIRAVERAVIETSEMEKSALDSLQSEGGPPAIIVFKDNDGETRAVLARADVQSETRAAHLPRLHAALRELMATMTNV